MSPQRLARESVRASALKCRTGLRPRRYSPIHRRKPMAAKAGAEVASCPERMDPNGMTPLTALMAKMGTETTDDPEFAWYEEELSPPRIQAAATVVTAGTTLTVYTTGDFTATDFVAGDLLLVESTTSTSAHWELVEVASNPTASNVLTITRGAASTTAAQFTTNTWLTRIGSVFAEGTDAPQATFRKPVKMFNYTEIFKTTYAVSKTVAKTRMRTGDPLKNERKRKTFFHAQSLEHAFIFGRRHETTGTSAGGIAGSRTGMPKRYTGGLIYFLREQSGLSTPPVRLITASSLTEDVFLDNTYQVFDYGYTGAGNERIVLCGNGFLNTLNKAIKNSSATRVNYDGTIKEFGMQLEVWRIPQGTFYLRTHPMFNVNSKFTNAALIINPAAIKYRPLAGRDTKPEDNIQPNGADYIAGQWLTEAGIEVNHLRTMLYIELI